MGTPPDENLPEVVPDQSPQALSAVEARYFAPELDGRDPKYPVTYDDAPKYMTPIETNPSEGGYPQDYASPISSIPWEQASGARNEPHSGAQESTEKDERIFGLKKRIFWIILIIVLVIVAAGVGGGVGGGIATAKSRDSGGEADSAKTTTSSNPAVSTTSAASSTELSTTPASTTSSSAEPTATFLNNQTAPAGFAFQAFSGRNYSGEATKVIRAEGFTDLPYNCSSYVWLPNGTDCCVTFCKSETDDVGWWCDPRYQTNSSTSFERIFVGCGSDAKEEKSRCS